MGSRSVNIETDVIDAPIPLLLSKNSMKKAGTEISFLTDEVKMFGETQKVHITNSGHYAIPLSESRTILKAVDKNPDVKLTLVSNDIKMQDKSRVAMKLHRQFGHPTKLKLFEILKRAGLGDDDELKNEVDKVYETCDICRNFKKQSPPPAVGLPHATFFNETVAMDLKFYKGKIILHLIDHLTRFSSAYVCKSKEPKEIIKGIFSCWIHVFGPPKKFLTDNGGEFANPMFLEMAESMNIRVLTTAAQSPWSNGLVERHNGVLACTLDKIMEECDDLTTALSWAIHAKNGLANVHGFSPAQLTLGYNPQLPSVLHNKAPALEAFEGSNVVEENLRCMRSARQAFLKAETSERVKRALKHNLRPDAEKKYMSGDMVFYKRNDSRKWKGPGRVIGSESSNVLIKHGSQYVRVHACRVMLDKRDDHAEEHVNSDGNMNNEKKEDDDCSTETSGSDEEDNVNQGTEEAQGYELNGSEGQESFEEVSEAEQGCPNKGLEDATSVISHRISSNPKPKLKPGMNICYEKEDGSIGKGKVVRRTGKATGKYGHFWEILDHHSNEKEEYDTENDWKTWKCEDSYPEEVNASWTLNEEIWVVEKECGEKKDIEVKQAKAEEIEKWQEQKVFEKVSDEGQDRISTTWVVTRKLKDGKEIVKARLVARGYEEDNKEIRSDSPTCQKDHIRMTLLLAVSNQWVLHSLDIKAAFLQGKKIDRELYVQPPKDFREPGVLWKLNKVVYGLCDASRNWYLKVVEVLKELGMQISFFDKAIFTFKTDKLEGIILIHVDDLLFFGSDVFYSRVMQKFKEAFLISREDRQVFKYLGIVVTQNPDGTILLDQKSFLEGMDADLLPSDSMKDKERKANAEEKKLFRQGIGKLGWITSITKPEASFSYCALSTVQSDPQIKDFVRYSKVVRDLKSSNAWIAIPKLNMNHLQVTAFSDASFGNLAHGASQIGYIVFVHDEYGNAVPVSWASKKAKRVSRSTLTAETQAAAEAVDTAFVIRKCLEEILGIVMPTIKLFVDNKSLHDAAKTTNLLDEKRLHVEMNALREMVDNKTIQIEWISTDKQLADVLTKHGVNKKKLTDVLSRGLLHF